MRISTLAIRDNIYLKKCLSLKTQVILDGNTFLMHQKKKKKKKGSQKKRKTTSNDHNKRDLKGKRI